MLAVSAAQGITHRSHGGASSRSVLDAAAESEMHECTRLAADDDRSGEKLPRIERRATYDVRDVECELLSAGAISAEPWDSPAELAPLVGILA